jgi:radical SAM-linked protein
MRLCEKPEDSSAALPPAKPDIEEKRSEESERIRIRFSKAGPMRLLSHLEMLNLFSRAVKRAGIPIRYSMGFHPHPKFSFATALSVGVESYAEHFDMEIEAGYGASRVREGLNSALPEGVEILEAVEIPLRSDSLSTIMDKIRYRVTLPEGLAEDLPALADAFLALEAFVHRREKQSKTVEIDLRKELYELHASGTVLEMVVSRGKPVEFAAAITGLPEKALADAKIEKIEVIFKPRI